MSGRRKGYNYQKVDIDLSILRGPLSLPEEGVLQIIKCIQSGTSEIRETLLFEIDVIYECRVCRGLFRSLTNLLAHKRVYCQEKFKDTKLEFVPSYTENETVVVQPEAPEDDAINDDKDTDPTEKSDPDANEANDVSNTVINQMSEGKFEGQSDAYNFYTKAVERQQDKDSTKTTAVVALKRINCNPNAVYQSCQRQNSESCTNSNSREKKRRQSSKDSEDEYVDVDDDLEDQRDSPKDDKMELDVPGTPEDHPEIITIQPEAASGPLRMSLRQRSGGEVTTPIIISLSQRADCEVKTKTCLICNTQYSSLKTLHFHMMNCHSEKRTIFPCLYCSQEFTQMLGVTRHLSRVHHKSKETIEKLRLTLRKKAYSKPLEDIKDMKLERPEKVVKKKEEGPPKRVPQKTHITMHTVRGQSAPAIATESSCQSFKCIHCSKFFKKQESLDRHASFCFTSQATMGQLSGTELPKNLHGNMEETMETGCTDIGRWTTSDLSTEDAKQLSNMVNEVTLTCLKCDQSYSSISNLHRHAVRHLGRMRFKCRLCQYTAYNRSECKTHLRRVHPGRVFDEAELNNYILDLGQDNMTGRSRSRSESPADEVADNGKPKSSPGKPSTYMDHLTTLRTRSGLYIKPRFAIKRKAEAEDSMEGDQSNPDKRMRVDSNCDEDNDSSMATDTSQQEEKDSDDVFVMDSGDSQDSALSEQLENQSCGLAVCKIENTEGGVENESASGENPGSLRVPSLIIKKVSLSESCVLPQPAKTEDNSSGNEHAATNLPNVMDTTQILGCGQPREDHLAGPVPPDPTCGTRSRDTSPDILLEQNTPKKAVLPDWTDVWSSKSDNGEEEFLGFRLVSDAQKGSLRPFQSNLRPTFRKIASTEQPMEGHNSGGIVMNYTERKANLMPKPGVSSDVTVQLTRDCPNEMNESSEITPANLDRENPNILDAQPIKTELTITNTEFQITADEDKPQKYEGPTAITVKYNEEKCQIIIQHGNSEPDVECDLYSDSIAENVDGVSHEHSETATNALTTKTIQETSANSTVHDCKKEQSLELSSEQYEGQETIRAMPTHDSGSSPDESGTNVHETHKQNLPQEKKDSAITQHSDNHSEDLKTGQNVRLVGGNGAEVKVSETEVTDSNSGDSSKDGPAEDSAIDAMSKPEAITSPKVETSTEGNDRNVSLDHQVITNSESCRDDLEDVSTSVTDSHIEQVTKESDNSRVVDDSSVMLEVGENNVSQVLCISVDEEQAEKESDTSTVNEDSLVGCVEGSQNVSVVGSSLCNQKAVERTSETSSSGDRGKDDCVKENPLVTFHSVQETKQTDATGPLESMESDMSSCVDGDVGCSRGEIAMHSVDENVQKEDSKVKETPQVTVHSAPENEAVASIDALPEGSGESDSASCTDSGTNSTASCIPQIVIHSVDEATDQPDDSGKSDDMPCGGSERDTSTSQIPQITVHSASDNEPKDDDAREGSTGNWKSGYLIPDIIICPPSVSACSEESDDLSDERGDNNSKTDTKTEATEVVDRSSPKEAEGINMDTEEKCSTKTCDEEPSEMQYCAKPNQPCCSKTSYNADTKAAE